MNNLTHEVKVVSEGKQKRECIDYILAGKKVVNSRTFHQRKVAGTWINSDRLGLLSARSGKK